MIVPVDVADADQVFAAADRVEAELGAIDVWVNVAFTSVLSPFEKISPAEYRGQLPRLRVHHMAALQRMKPRNRGTLVQVGSALAYRGIPLQTRGTRASSSRQLVRSGVQIRASRIIRLVPAGKTQYHPLQY